MSQTQLLTQHPFPPRSDRRLLASDPNVDPELLLALAMEYPYEVRDNPLLPLLAVADPAFYEKIRERLLVYFRANLLFDLERPALIPLGDVQLAPGSQVWTQRLDVCLQRLVRIRGLVLEGSLEGLYVSDVLFGNMSQFECAGRMAAGLYSARNARALFNAWVEPGLSVRVNFEWEGQGIGTVSGYFLGEREEERPRRR